MSIFGWKRRKTAQYVSNRCKDLFKRKKYFGVRCTLTLCSSDTHPFCHPRQIVASVYRCFYSFILHKSGDELFVNHLPFLFVFWLKLQQVFQRSSSNSRHLGSSKNACYSVVWSHPLCVLNVVKKLSSLAIVRQHGFHILESGWGSNFPEIPRTLCEFNTCSLQGSQEDANKKTD